MSQHGEVERRPTQRRRRQVNVALHVVQVLQHPGVALHAAPPARRMYFECTSNQA